MKDQSENRRGDIRRYLLVLRCQAGDDDAFKTLYDLFNERTLRYLNGLLGEDSAWDIQQEVWLIVYQQISELMNPDGFRTWLYRITHRQAVDHLRSKNRRLNLRKNAVAEFKTSISPDMIEEVFEIDNAMELSGIIDELVPAHKEVIMLKYWEGMSYEEIALIVGCPVGTVRSRIYYAKQKIKELLD